MAPAIVLAVAIVLVLTQLCHLVFSGRVRYWKRLALTTLAVVLGELAGGNLLPPGPRLGDLHPLWDIAFTAVFQLLGNRFLR